MKISVQPSISSEDQPVHFAVTGLPPSQSVSLQLSSTDADGVKWESSATYRADASGDFSLDSMAATSGSYSGVNGMGLISSMLPVTNQAPDTGYFWGSPQQRLTFTLAVVDSGAVIASAKFQRRFSPISVAVHSETLAVDGFVGDYFAPETEGEHPAFLTFGGSEGGNSTFLLAGLLAAHGYPSLALAYFDEPGLPQTLSDIPLEYFAKALQWLDGQPGVDPARVWVLGDPRGSEAALLLGVHYPQLVHGVIASVPSDVALCSYPGCSGPAWTLDGQPVPYTHQFDNPDPSDDPAAVIPVEQIAGPVFLDCGGDDQVWISWSCA
jgi:dienelactone hydrolase